MEKIFRLAKVRYAVMTNIPYVEDGAKVQKPEAFSCIAALPDTMDKGTKRWKSIDVLPVFSFKSH